MGPVVDPSDFGVDFNMSEHVENFTSLRIVRFFFILPFRRLKIMAIFQDDHQVAHQMWYTWIQVVDIGDLSVDLYILKHIEADVTSPSIVRPFLLQT